jgi:hypothetical protein
LGVLLFYAGGRLTHSPRHDRSKANVLDLSKWDFFVISKRDINQIFGDQKSVTLSVLEKNCARTGFNGLWAIVDTCKWLS